jgi:hypothetical protein
MPYDQIEQVCRELESYLKDQFQDKVHKGEDTFTLPIDKPGRKMVSQMTLNYFEGLVDAGKLPFVFDFQIMGGEQIKEQFDDLQDFIAYPLEKRSEANTFGSCNIVIPKDDVKQFQMANEAQQTEDKISPESLREQFQVIEGGGHSPDNKDREFDVIISKGAES